MAAKYKGDLPIDKEFLSQNKHRRIVTEVEFRLDDVILANGYEEMDVMTDEALGVRLEDLFYKLREVDRDRMVLQVTGVVR